MLIHGNMSISDLSKATGLPQPTLYQLYVGITKSPRKTTLSILSNYFSITVNQLSGEEKLPFYLPEKIKKQLEINTIPIVNWEDLHPLPEKINFSNKEELFIETKSKNLRFSIKVINSEMDPVFPKGSILIFDVNNLSYATSKRTNA